MEEVSTTHKTLKNISYRFVAYLWPMVFTIFITPIIVLKLGVKEYGIYIFIGAITGLLGLLDLGISYSVIKFLAEYQARADESRMKKLIFSANSLFLLIGLVGLAISFFVAIAGHWLFAAKFAGQEYYLILFVVAGFNFFISSINNIYGLIPTALQRFDVSSKIEMAYLTLSALINLIVVMLGYKLLAIFIGQLILVIIFVYIRRRYAIAILPLAKYRLDWDQTEIKKCYQFGLATVVNNTASTSLAYLDRLIIPLFIGPSQLTYYSLPGNVAARIPGVTDNLVGVIFPITAGLASTGDHDKIRRFYLRSFRLIFVISAAISLSVIFLSQEILRYWLSPDFAEKSTYILIVLVLTNFIISILSPVNGFIYGLGKLKLSSILNAVMAAINALLLFILLPKFGIAGAAWAYLFSVLPIFYMIYYMETRYFELSDRGWHHLKTLLQVGATTFVFYFIVRFLIAPLVSSLASLIVLGPTTVIIFLVLYFLFGFFEKEDSHDLKKFASSAIVKLTRLFTHG